jgi:hypothetical protein
MISRCRVNWRIRLNPFSAKLVVKGWQVGRSRFDINDKRREAIDTMFPSGYRQLGTAVWNWRPHAIAWSRCT